MPRYVLLRHDTPADPDRPVHWDLMLESEGVLWTWALSEMPSANKSLDCERLADHRIAYLDYEGPISGDRGEVRRVMSGEFRFEDVSGDRIRLLTTVGELPRQVEFVRQADSQRWIVKLDDGK
jgi:hypothetical protein